MAATEAQGHKKSSIKIETGIKEREITSLSLFFSRGLGSSSSTSQGRTRARPPGRPLLQKPLRGTAEGGGRPRASGGPAAGGAGYSPKDTAEVSVRIKGFDY